MTNRRVCYFCKGEPDKTDTRIVHSYLRMVCRPPCPQTRAHDRGKSVADDGKIDGLSVSDV